MTFPKHHDITDESRIYQHWRESGFFSPEKTAHYRAAHDRINRDESYTIMLPPPNVTGKLHVGHAMMVAVEDVLVRHARMQGYRTLWLPGTDHAAISTQSVVEKNLRAEGRDRIDLGRDGFLSEVRDFVDEHRNHITGQLASLGASLDRSRETYTLAEGPSRAVRHAFKTLSDRNKIYTDNYVVNWSPGAQSVISNEEVEYREEQGKLYYLKYFVEGKGYALTVATTRPETIFADVAVAVNPLDKRWKKHIGKNVLIPLINKPIPIIADEYVDVSFGTGVLKITPTHDPNDFEVAKKHDLPMDQYAFDKDTVFSSLAGEFAGKPVYEFVDNVIEYIKDIGNLDRVESYNHSVPYCERTGCRVEPLLSQQWFMDVSYAADTCTHRLDEGQVTIHPQRYETSARKQYLDQIRPRCISRQIRWGHRMPVWYDTDHTAHIFTEDDIIAQDSSGNHLFDAILFNLVADQRLYGTRSLDVLIELFFGPSLTPQRGSTIEQYVAMYKLSHAGDDLDELIQVLNAYADDDIDVVAETILDRLSTSAGIVEGHKQTYHYDIALAMGRDAGSLIQSEDTLDTWFSSALRPFSTLGWPEQTHDFKDFFANTVLETGYDIIFFWVIRMMMMAAELIEEPPFEHVYLHGLVRDDQGRKMSKSLGNVLNPLEVIHEHGTDALRLSLLSKSTVGMDKNYSDADTKYYRRFLNKLWNAARFTTTFELPDDAGLGAVRSDPFALDALVMSRLDEVNDFDLWIMHIVNDMIYTVDKLMGKFSLGEASHQLVGDIWQYFCDWYIEIAKISPSPMTTAVLRVCLYKFLQLLHPFAPFVTHQLWQHLGFGTELMMTPWPTQWELPNKNYKISLLMDIITAYRVLRTKATNKSHEKVNIAFQAGTAMSDYIREHELLVRRLVHVNEVQYISDKESIPTDYTTDVVVDMVLGVEVVHTISKAEQLANLREEKSSEEQFLHNVRKMLSNVKFVSQAPKDVIATKRKKMEEVKARIEALDIEIRRLQM